MLFFKQLFSPISEIPIIGRNIPYVVSFGLFVILCVPTALANSYASLLVLRFLTGFMGSPCLATGGATMGDMVRLDLEQYLRTYGSHLLLSSCDYGPRPIIIDRFHSLTLSSSC